MFNISYSKGHNACTRVLDAVVTSPTFDVKACKDFIDEKGNTPLHLAIIHQKREVSVKLVRALIETHGLLIDPAVRNKDGVSVTDVMEGKDKRRTFLAMATTRVQEAAKQQNKPENLPKGSEESDESEEEASVVHSTSLTNRNRDRVAAPRARKSTKVEDPYEKLSMTEKLEMQLKQVFGRGEEYFVAVKQDTEDEVTPY